MIEDLLHWDIKSRKLAKYGREVAEINRDFMIVMWSLEDELPDIHLAKSLKQRIPDLRARINKLSPRNDFYRLVTVEFNDSLVAQYEFIRLIFFKNYTEYVGVKRCLDHMFGEATKKPEGHAFEELEAMARKINWKKISRRRSLMFPILIRQVDSDYDRMRPRIEEELRKVRQVLNSYFESMCFVTKEQAEVLNKLNSLTDIDVAKIPMETAFGGISFSKIPEFLREKMFRKHGMSEEQYNKFVQERKKFLTDDDIRALFYDLDHVPYGGFWYPDASQMEIGRSQFVYWKDEKKQKINLFAGDLLSVAGHEGYHRLRTILSRFMPPGLKGSLGESSITFRIMDEGLSMFFEEFFLDYVAENKQFKISKKDIERAKLSTYSARVGCLIRFLYSVYHRLEDRENRDIQAAARLAKVTRNQAYSDPKYLQHLSVHETLEDTFYVYGDVAVRNIWERLIKEKTKEHGNRRNAMRHIKRNETAYLAGLFIGHWGPTTIEEFYFDHYLPRVEELDLLD